MTFEAPVSSGMEPGRPVVDHPIRGRANAWFFAALDGYMDRKYAAVKRHLIGAAPPLVLEIGSGSGTNFRYFAPGTRLIAVEPNIRMHATLRRRARRFGIDLDLRGMAGEAIDVPDESVDLAIASLVLCSVANPAQVVAEVRRVLRPGGRFVCVEHVAAASRSALSRLQRTIRRPWSWIFEGCDLCRDTESVLRDAAFSRVDVDRITVPTVFLPIRTQIAAVCVR